MQRASMLFAALLFGTACSDVTTLGPDPVQPEPPPVAIQQGLTIELADGRVQGESADGTRTFIGIPFAAPPVGERRWKPPAPAEPWQDTLMATGDGVACIQTPGDDPELADGVQMSEDCLKLNVYAPDPAPEGPVPVMVWLYGGSNKSGSANQKPAPGLPRVYDGARLRHAAPRQVVVVTVNYRLGSLGFLAHPALTREQGRSGNYGLMDQQAALRWVQKNIRAFGGDPKNVTLFGESAGGLDTCYQTVAKGSEGLFQRAIIESSACIFKVNTLSEGEAAGTKLAAKLGCPGDESVALDCLRKLPAMDARQPTMSPYPGAVFLASPDPDHERVWGEMDTGGLAVIDGKLLVEQPIVSYSAGRQAQISLIVGTNAREAASWQQAGKYAFADEDQYRRSLVNSFGGNADRVAEQYSVAKFGSLSEAAVALVTDMVFVCGARTVARTASRHAPVYVYDWQRPFDVGQFQGLGAAHSVELAWVWDWWAFAGHPPAEVDRTAQVAAFWTSFAERGDPNHDGAPAWPKYVEDVDPEFAFADEPTVVEGRRDARCGLWDSVLASQWGDDWAAP